MGLAQMLLVQGRIDQGFVHLRRARDLDPMSPVLNALEAGFLVDAGRPDEARVRLNRAFDIAPEHGLPLQALAWLRLAENRPDEAVGALRRAAAARAPRTRVRCSRRNWRGMAGRPRRIRSSMTCCDDRPRATFRRP